MINLQDNITFVNSKLNSDDDIQLMPSGDHPVFCSALNEGALNVEIQEGHMLIKSRAKGNELESYNLPNGTNKVLGGCPDIENNAYIYFVYNSNGDNRVVRYNFDASFDTIYSDAGNEFEFDVDYPIRSCGIIGSGTEAQLWWNDGHVEPRKTNLYNLENAGYASLNNYNINLLKPSPVAKFTYTYGHDDSYASNYVINFFAQVAYRYVYDTKEKSVLSPYHFVLYDYGAESPMGIPFAPRLFNYIQFTIPVPDGAIDFIEIYIRNCDVGGGVVGVWQLYDTIVASTPNTTYNFYNNKNVSDVDQDDASLLFHAVPHTVQAMCSIRDNRLVLGECDIGRDNIDIDVTYTVVDARMSSPAVGEDTASYSTEYQAVANGFSYDFSIYGDDSDTTAFTNKIIIFNGVDIVESYMVNDTKGLDNGGVVDLFVETITADTALSITPSNAANKLRILNGTGATLYMMCYVYIDVWLYRFRTFKSGTRKFLGMVYYDENFMPGRVQKEDDSYVDIPYMTEKGTTTSNDYLFGIKYEIVHLPPSWASYYSFVIAEDGVRYFQIPMMVGDDMGYARDVVINDTYVEVDLVQMQERISSQRPGLQMNYFDLQVGDVMKVVGKYNTNDDDEDLFTIDEYIELKILKVTTDKIHIERWDGYDSHALLNGNTEYDCVLVEFFSKSNVSSDNLVYKEVGDILSISGGYHQASTISTGYNDDFGVTAQHQTAEQNAVGMIKQTDTYKDLAGDSYILYADFFDIKVNSDNNVGAVCSYIETQSASLCYNSRFNGYGRINIYDKDYARRTIKAVAWGGTYGEGGLSFNELNKFEEGDRRYLDNKHGEIECVVEEGSSIKVIQKNKTTSIGVGFNEVALQDGTYQVYAVDAVLGTPRPLMQNYGTVFPRSVVKHDRYIYFYDIYAGAVLRYSPSGLENISEQSKMGKYFRYKSRQLLGLGISNVEVIGGYDPLNNLYVLTFIDNYQGSYSETIAYNENKGFFTSFYSFVPEHYGIVGENIFLSFKSGACYKHNSVGVYRSNFYGANYDSDLWIVSNKEPLKTKRFISLVENANTVWHAEDNDAIVVFSDSQAQQDAESYMTYRFDMESSLYEENFKARDSEFVAHFLRDSQSSGLAFSIVDLYNGRQLRGKGMILKLTNSDATEAYLRSLTVNSYIS